MAITDIVTLILSLFFLSLGASRGFMNSLMGPFSIIVTTILSVIYYQTTKDIITSLAIGLIGPLILVLLLKFLLKTWAKATDRERPGFLSSLTGAILTFIWGWVFIILTLILLAVLPPWGKTLSAVHDDVMKSNSYLSAKPWENILFAAPPQNATAAASKASGSDVKSLAEDPRFQKILQDPDIQKEIDAHDIVKLMKNPKMMDLVQQLMSDPATMKKVFALYRTQPQPQVTKNP